MRKVRMKQLNPRARMKYNLLRDAISVMYYVNDEDEYTRMIKYRY